MFFQGGAFAPPQRHPPLAARRGARGAEPRGVGAKARPQLHGASPPAFLPGTVQVRSERCEKNLSGHKIPKGWDFASGPRRAGPLLLRSCSVTGAARVHKRVRARAPFEQTLNQVTIAVWDTWLWRGVAGTGKSFFPFKTARATDKMGGDDKPRGRFRGESTHQRAEHRVLRCFASLSCFRLKDCFSEALIFWYILYISSNLLPAFAMASNVLSRNNTS